MLVSVKLHEFCFLPQNSCWGCTKFYPVWQPTWHDQPLSGLQTGSYNLKQLVELNLFFVLRFWVIKIWFDRALALKTVFLFPFWSKGVHCSSSDGTFVVIFSSPLIRSKRTAEIIWGDRNEEMISESDLREIDLYAFQVSLDSDSSYTENRDFALRISQIDMNYKIAF